MGVCIGMISKLLIHLVRGVWLRNLFKIYFKIEYPNQRTIVIKLTGSALFSNFLPLKKALSKLETGKMIVFNFTASYLIDYTVMEYIQDFSHDYIAQGGQCHQVGAPLKIFLDYQLAAELMTKEDRKS